MTKTSIANKIIKDIADSPNLKYLIKNIHNYWHNADEKKYLNNISSTSKITPSTELDNSTVTDNFIEKEIEVTPVWAHSLKAQHQILEKIRNISDIADMFEYNRENSELSILSFIVISSQWNTLVNIWQACADQCKHTKEQPPQEYLEVLNNALYLYNLTLSDNRASLKAPLVGDIYDYNLQNKVAGNNKNITKVLLPALYSASNKIDKTALVIT